MATKCIALGDLGRLIAGYTYIVPVSGSGFGVQLGLWGIILFEALVAWLTLLGKLKKGNSKTSCAGREEYWRSWWLPVRACVSLSFILFFVNDYQYFTLHKKTYIYVIFVMFNMV